MIAMLPSKISSCIFITSGLATRLPAFVTRVLWLSSKLLFRTLLLTGDFDYTPPPPRLLPPTALPWIRIYLLTWACRCSNMISIFSPNSVKRNLIGFDDRFKFYSMTKYVSNSCCFISSFISLLPIIIRACNWYTTNFSFVFIKLSSVSPNFMPLSSRSG
jgi:hypothetical protein